MIKSIVIEVQPFVGCQPVDVIGDMVVLADRIGIPVRATVRAVRVSAQPGDSFEDVFASWSRQPRPVKP